MLPAQPPNSRRSVGTRNDTFRMCTCSGRICCAKRPGKVVMVSNARDPQIKADMGAPKLERTEKIALSRPRGHPASGIEDLDGVAGHARVRHREQDMQRRFGA